MGTGWSQEDHPQSQQNREESESSENATEGKPVCHCNASEKRSNGDNKAAESAKTAPENIHNFDGIMQDADFAIDRISRDKLFTQLQHGILLNQNRKASLISNLM
ncbi:hypothetical protein L484_018469 [Morus notabilis]|uniref:Uncharacterized protein n=1 Tax=Morus notabilis TaxID=981085 RepID=W9SBJ4_9ROSA|nr:hypothetical protein L484_018469 [Morus notabilis]